MWKSLSMIQWYANLLLLGQFSPHTKSMALLFYSLLALQSLQILLLFLLISPFESWNSYVIFWEWNELGLCKHPRRKNVTVWWLKAKQQTTHHKQPWHSGPVWGGRLAQHRWSDHRFYLQDIKAVIQNHSTQYTTWTVCITFSRYFRKEFFYRLLLASLR